MDPQLKNDVWKKVKLIILGKEVKKKKKNFLILFYFYFYKIK